MAADRLVRCRPSVTAFIFWLTRNYLTLWFILFTFRWCLHDGEEAKMNQLYRQTCINGHPATVSPDNG